MIIVQSMWYQGINALSPEELARLFRTPAAQVASRILDKSLVTLIGITILGIASILVFLLLVIATFFRCFNVVAVIIIIIGISSSGLNTLCMGPLVMNS